MLKYKLIFYKYKIFFWLVCRKLLPLQLDVFYCMITPQEQTFDNEGLELNKGLTGQTKTVKYRVSSYEAKTFEPILIIYRNTLAFIVNVITIGGFKL